MDKQTDLNDAERFLESMQGGGGSFIKAKDVKGKKTLAVIVKVREANLPNSGPTLVLDIEVKKQPYSLPLNATNLKKMIELHGGSSNKWIGKVITLYKVLVTNPKTRQEVESLRIK